MNEASPQVIIIAGPNGAGKTTLAPFLLRDRFRTSAFVNADAIASGLSAFEPENVAIEAGRLMLRRLHELSEQRQSFAFETTLAARSYAPWIRRLQSSVMKCICYLFRFAAPNSQLKEWQSECGVVDTRF